MAITYDAGTNTLTVVGGLITGTVTSTSTTTTINDIALGNTWNGSASLPGRQGYFPSYNDVTGMIRTVLAGGYRLWSTSTDNGLAQAPAINSAYIISHNCADLYAASVAGGWNVVSKLGDTLYYITAHLIIGDGTTNTIFSGFNESIQFADSALNLGVKLKAIFQLGEFYNGLPKSGCILRNYASSATVSGAPNGGAWIFYSSSIILANQYAFNNGGYLIAKKTDFTGYRKATNVQVSLYSVGCVFENCTFSFTLADSSRNFILFMRALVTFVNVTVSDNVATNIEILTASQINLDGLIIGGGDKTWSIVRYYNGNESRVSILNPTNMTLANWTITNNQTTFLYVTIDNNYSCKVIDAIGDPIENVLVNLSDVNNTSRGTWLTTATGNVLPQRIIREQIQISNIVNNQSVLNPYTARYYKYGKKALELKKDFTSGTITDSILLNTDPIITQSEAVASAISGVTLLFGVFNDVDGNVYSLKIDCGNNSLIDVYHNLAYRLSVINPADAEVTNARDFSAELLLTSNGVNFYTDTGVYIDNYTGQLDFMTSNSGVRFAPLLYSMYTISNLKPRSEIKVYDSATMEEIGGIENVLGTTFTHQYLFTGTTVEAIIVIINENYQIIRMTAMMDGSSVTVPVEQVLDRVFYNPPSPVMANNIFNVGKNGTTTFSLAELAYGMQYNNEPLATNNLTSISVTNQPNHGTLTANPNGTYSYSPSTDFLGSDEFEFMPTFSSTYEGVILPFKSGFSILPYAGRRYDNIIVLGDSILTLTFNSALRATFFRKFKELYGRDINLYVEAVSGWNSGILKLNINSILSKYTSLTPTRTLCICSIGTNDLQAGDRTASIVENTYSRQAIYNNYVYINNVIRSYNFDFSVMEITFLPFDTGSATDTVWDNETHTMLHEDYGSLYYNTQSYGVWAIAAQCCPEYMSGGQTIDQLYNLTRQWRDYGYYDKLHPNDFGRLAFQQCLLDGILLYNEYGIKPALIDGTLNHQVSINLTNDVDLITTTEPIGRLPNNLDYTAGITDAPLNYNNGVLSPYTITISQNGTLVASNIDPLQKIEYMPTTFLKHGVQIAQGLVLSITIAGLTPNSVYKFQGIGTSSSNYCVGLMAEPDLDRESEANCSYGLFYQGNGSLAWNSRNYYDFTLIPQNTSITLTLVGKDVPYNIGGMINAIQFWKLST
jgi:hypothetical protein